MDQSKSQQTFMNRLRMLESNMSRLVQQHHSLVPLIDLLNLIPEVNKHRQSIQGVHEKLSVVKDELLFFLSQIKKTQHKTASILLKNLNNEITESKKKLKQIEELSKRMGKESILKNRIRTTMTSKSIDNNLQTLKKDFKESLNTQIQKMNEKQLVEKLVNQRFQPSDSQFKGHIENIKRQMGLLQCQVQFYRDKQLRQELTKTKILTQNTLKQKSPNQTDQSRNLAITEHQFYLNNYFQFQQSNYDRLKYQLELIEVNLKKFPVDKSLAKKTIQLQYYRDRYYSIINQIKGTKYRSNEQLMKIENKTQRLITLISTNKFQQILQKQELKLKQAKEAGKKHMSLLQQYVQVIDDKFKNIQKTL